MATVMAGYEAHRGWLNYLTVVAEGKRRLGALGCPKINLQVRHGNAVATRFWAALGYVVDDAVSIGRGLIHDD